MFPIKIERAWLRIIVSVIVGGIAGSGLYMGVATTLVSQARAITRGTLTLIFLSGFVMAPLAATALAHLLTPREKKDGHTRCGKCGYILKGLTEPRCSECGERI